MSLITLSVTNNTVSLGQTAVVPVNLSGIGTTVSAIVWDTVIEQGNLFEVVAFGATYVAPPATITDFSPYQSYVDEANNILYAENNPIVAYATTAAGVAVGSSLEITTYPQTVPVGYTTDYTPGISTYSNFNLYWAGTGIGFTWSPWPLGASTATAIDAGQEWVNNEANLQLASTDWIDSRVALGGTFNPDWYNWRVGLTTYTRQKIDDLEALTDINDVYDYVTSDWYFSIPFVPLGPPYRP